ncbi:MAG: FecR domain-containing protein [Betaproteobacteria bacterium]
MNHTPPTHDERARFEVACDWFVQLREQPQSTEVISGWLEWLDADPRNQEDFGRARQIWQLTEHVQDDPARTGTARRRWLLPMASAAALLGLTIGVAWWSIQPPGGATYATARGETRSVELPDGSHLELAGDSRLTVKMSAARRDIDLLKGEAYFQVAHDTARPFVVQAGTLHVTAVGTAFNVRTAVDRVSVAVEEGVVVVDPRADAVAGEVPSSGEGGDSTGANNNTQRISVRRGQEVTVALTESRVHVVPIEPRSVASWRAGRLHFAREPLSAVLESVRAASGVDIRVVDPAVGDLLFTGTVFNDQVPEWAEGLPVVFPVVVHRQGATILVEQKK